MRNLIFKTLSILTIALLSGCASVYKPIYPPRINYTSHDLNDGISLSYKYDVLREKGNRKYARKEEMRNVKVISLKITNNTDSVIGIGKDVSFYSGYKQVFPMEPIVLKKSIKQNAPSYLLYLLLTPLKLSVTTNTNTMDPSIETYSIGYVLGPALALGNLAVAGSANTNLEQELYDYNILNRDINPKETVYGIIGIKGSQYDRLSIRKAGSIIEPKQSSHLTLTDIKQKTTIHRQEPTAKLKEDLYKTDSTISYETYYKNIIQVSYYSEISNSKLSKEKYPNGNFKSIGIKAQHKIGYDKDDLYSSINTYYKIGTWRYFYNNGQIKLLVDYNLNEIKDGRYIEYDTEGNIKTEKKYKEGKVVK